MKKIFVAVLFLFSPAFAFAQSFEADVSYGMKGDAVLEVQEFLGTQGCFSGPYTGNFYSLTLAGVKCFQQANNIRTTGYFGPLSRARALEIVAASKADDEVSETAPVVQPQIPAKPSMVFTLPNGSVVSIAPDGTITTIYTPPAPVASSSPSTPVQDQPAQQTPPAQSTPETPAQPAPFVRSGSASISGSNATPVSVGVRQSIGSLSIVNGTNETLLFQGNINARASFSNNTITGYSPRLAGYYRNNDLSSDTRGIRPGETGVVQIFLEPMPSSAGQFDLSIGMTLVGQTSGDYVDVGSIVFGTVRVQ